MYMYIWGNNCKYIVAISKHGILSHMYFLLDIYSFIYLAAPGLRGHAESCTCGMKDLSL